MTLNQRLEAVAEKEAQFKKLKAELTHLEGELNSEMQGVFRLLGLPDQFSPLSLVRAALNHSEIVKP